MSVDDLLQGTGATRGDDEEEFPSRGNLAHLDHLDTYCSNMTPSNTDDSMPDLPTVMTKYENGVMVVTITSESSGRLRVNLNDLPLYDNTISAV